MATLTHQSAINPKRNFWLASGTISSLTVNSLNVTGNATISSIVTNTISSANALIGNLSSAFITANTLDTNLINTNVIDANTISTINFYADVLNVDEGTISSISTNAIELDGAYLTVVNGTTILLNGIPIATTQNLSSIQDWAIFPAVSSIFTLSPDNDIGSITQPFRAGYFSTLSSGNLNVSTINGGGIVSGSNWSFYPALNNVNVNGYNLNNVGTTYTNDIRTQFGKANVNFAVSNVSVPNQGIMMDAVGNIVVQNSTDYYTLINGSLYTSQYGSANNKTQIDGKQVIVDGGAIDRTTITAGDIVTRTVRVGDVVSETAEVAIYGRYLTAFDNALYVSGGFTTEGGFTHGVSLGCAGLGTYPASAMANRIDLLPIGTQLFQTFGATAIIAGLGITIDTGLGMNLAAGLVLDFLAKDIKIRANNSITLDADNDINMRTKNITMTTNNLTQNVNNFVFNDSNFTVNSSNQNTFNTSKILAGTPLPPSTLGFYSTTMINSQIAQYPLGAFITSQKKFGLYENISTLSWEVTSNISTSFSTNISSLISSYTSTITSSLVTRYSTLSILQNFPIGEVNLTTSSLLLQHSDKIEIDTKPFPVFTTLTPGLSTLVSSLYAYKSFTDGFVYDEIGEIIQTIVPVVDTISTFNLSTSISSGYVFSTLTSSFFSTLVSQTTFTSSIFNTAYFDSYCFSTPCVSVSSLNGFSPFPAPYGSFTSMSSFTLGANPELPIAYDNTEYALGTYYNLSAPTEVKVDTAGLYRVIASVQFDTTTNQIEIVNLYFKKNGNLVPRSNSKTSIAKDAEDVITVEILIDLTPSDFLEVWFASTDINMSVTAFPAGGVEPETPSIILNIQKIGM